MLSTKPLLKKNERTKILYRKKQSLVLYCTVVYLLWVLVFSLCKTFRRIYLEREDKFNLKKIFSLHCEESGSKIKF